jgi:hypothetical protein
MYGGEKKRIHGFSDETTQREYLEYLSLENR